MDNRQFGIVGLGRMGGNLALRAIEKGYSVVGYDPHPTPKLEKAGVRYISRLSDFAEFLTPQRRVFLWVPAGPLVDIMSDELSQVLEPGDIVIDGGNSYWADSKRRAKTYHMQGLYFLDLGTSGGIEGARYAPCFMIGGPEAGVALVEPLLKDLAVEGGYVHAGDSGAGHFTKLVHNGIEFGMLQAIGEGMDLLRHYPGPLRIANTVECWRHGSVIRSWLIDLMARSLKEDEQLRRPTGYIEDTGEVNWLITDALTFDVAVPVIAQSVMMLLKSRDVEKYADKAVIQMRHEFGGHPFGPEASVRHEREHGRVGAPYQLAEELD